MNKTQHFIIRQGQCGIHDNLLKIVEENGTYSNAPGGATKIHLGKRECQKISLETRRFLKTIERAQDITIIIQDSNMLTVYKQN